MILLLIMRLMMIILQKLSAIRVRALRHETNFRLWGFGFGFGFGFPISIYTSMMHNVRVVMVVDCRG